MLSGNSLRQTVHTHRASVHQAAKLVAALLRVARVTVGLAESNGSLPLGLWLTSPAGWLPRTGISSGTLCSVIEYGLALAFLHVHMDLIQPLTARSNKHCCCCSTVETGSEKMPGGTQNATSHCAGRTKDPHCSAETGDDTASIRTLCTHQGCTYWPVYCCLYILFRQVDLLFL